MKKLTYIALVALAVLTACSKVEMDSYAPARKVTFQAAAYVPQTKANVPLWGEFDSFSAKAFLHAEGYSGETQDIFGTATNNHVETITPYKTDGTAATAETNVSYWGPSHDYYWPKSQNSYLNFIAWKGATPTTASETSLSWEGYTVANDGSDNLLFADEAWHYNKVAASATNASQYTDDAVTSGVPMLFHHALAQLRFKANLINATATGGMRRTVTISSFTLTNVYNQGSLSLTNSDPANDEPAVTEATTKAWTGGWSDLASPIALSKTDLTLSEMGTDYDLVPLRAVIPQAVTDDMVLSISYSINTYYGEATNPSIVENISVSKALSEYVPSNAINSWNMGYSITYTLQFNAAMDLIIIKPDLANWESNGGSVTAE